MFRNLDVDAAGIYRCDDTFRFKSRRIIRKLDADLEKIVVGQIKKIETHPDADKLIICQVDVGTGETIQIVTGAPNVKEGDKVPVVLDGGRVAGGHDGKSRQKAASRLKKEN